jgi:hypothetical protein
VPIHPNFLAYLALLAELPVCLVVCSVVRPPVAATALILFLPLFLPQSLAFDFPGLPSFSKETITYLGVLLAMSFYQPQRLARARPGRGPELLVGLLVTCGFATVLTNRDVLVYGPTVKPGLDLWGALATTFEDLVRFGIPFFMGRALIRSARDLRQVLVQVVVAGVILTPLIAIELRLSPQLHNWIYGYLPDEFGATRRWGGYRPLLFMESGIAVGIFMATTVMAASTLGRLRALVFGAPAALLQWYLLLFLVAVKSVAAAVWGTVFLAVISLASARWMSRLAVVLVVFVTSYPALRLLDVFPRETLVSVAAAFDETRAGSLNYRFENENRMLAKWRERPWFGWGGYSRNWVFDPDTGRSMTVPDGAWIIQVGSRGATGLAALFGLYLVPVWVAARSLRRIPGQRDRLLVAGTLLIVLVRLLDQLPNGFYSSFPIFLSGALHGTVAQLVREARRARRRKAAPAPRPAPPAIAPG